MDSKNMKMKERNRTLDVVRGIGILLVLASHTWPRSSLAVKYIYSFHMPLFFILSGAVFSGPQAASPGEYLRKKARRLIVPYFTMAFLCLGIVMLKDLILAARGHGHPDLFLRWGKYTAGILYSRGTLAWMPECSPLWFLTCLFTAQCLYYAFWRISRNRTHAVSGAVLLSGVLGAALSLSHFRKLPWNADSALTAVVFLHAGFLLRKFWTAPAAGFKGFAMPAILLLALVSLASAFLNPVELVDFDSHHFGNPFLMYSGALSGAVLVCCLGSLLASVRPSDPAAGLLRHFLEYFGTNTLPVFGFNYAVLFAVNLTLHKLMSMAPPALFFISFFIQLAVMGLLISLIRRCETASSLINGEPSSEHRPHARPGRAAELQSL